MPTRARTRLSRGFHGEGSRIPRPTAEEFREIGEGHGHRPGPAPTAQGGQVHHRTDRLADSRYLLLTTFGEDGNRLESQLWVVPDGTALGIWTPAHSGEAERIRRHPRVLIGPCDAHGRPTGRRLPARAQLCDADDTARYRASLLNKYGLTALLALARSRLRVGLAGTVGIRITLNELEQRLVGPDWQPPATYCVN